MAIRMSTGLVNAMMGTGSLKATFEATVGFEVAIYSGSQPASADDPPQGTLLVTLSNGGAGTTLTWDTAATNGALAKSTGQTWSGTGAANGTAGWFRIRKKDDTNLTSTTLARYDGACATSGAQMTLGTLQVTASAPISVSAASITMPKTA